MNHGALRMILDSLRYWATEMHVDGFRFDLTSALSRTGHDIDMRGAFMTAIQHDPVLRFVKLIAEPWDASMDGYQVGSFPPPWVEWNDRYRDTVRDFWREASGGVREIASRLAGSSDLYADDGRSPYSSVNFVTAHDGFTLRDLVSYDRKHNEANGEDNRDGTDDNRSWNCGVEGETDDPEIVALRHRQAANLMADPLPLHRRPDAHRRRRARPHPARQQQRLRAGQRDLLGRLASRRRVARPLRGHQAALRLRREHPALRQRHCFEGTPDDRGRPEGPRLAAPAGREMTGDDWDDDELGVVGMFVSGDPLRSPGPRGEQQLDSSFLIWLNSGRGRSTSPCPRTSGSTRARWCCPPTRT